MNNALFVPEHGGNLEAAAKHFAIDKASWLDLSSAVNPWHYPIVPLPTSCFTELPYWQQSFLDAVASFYGNEHFVVGAGTQAFIESLPKVLRQGQVLIPQSGYQEHQKAWRESHQVVLYPSFERSELETFMEKALANPESHVLIINPNNPTAMLMSPSDLQQIAAALAPGFYLIVDEAFIDPIDKHSLLQQPLADNVIVLRSLGKFFGLPGLRLGFAFANPAILQALRQFMPLWQITGASQFLAAKALADKPWQKMMRLKLNNQAYHQQKALEKASELYQGQWFHRELFSSFLLSKKPGEAIYQGLAKQGILLRFWQLNETQVLLRFARCDTPEAMLRLHKALAANLS